MTVDRNEREKLAVVFEYKHDFSISIVLKVLKKNDFYHVKSTRKFEFT